MRKNNEYLLPDIDRETWNRSVVNIYKEGSKCLLLNLLLGTVIASPSLNNAKTDTVVALRYGTFQGSATGNLIEFLGMPFAAPPVGNLRFSPPAPPQPFAGVRQATTFGAACFQQFNNASVLSVLGGTSNGDAAAELVVSEDCLFINVVKPANLPNGKKLPVVFWIYGGAFDSGDTSVNPGDTVVARSIALGEPVIYVSANYRTSALGFLGGAQVKAAGLGNLGLRDQRFAMEWVQQHISAFGGDPSKVTIWGESAGAISIGAHLVINDGDPKGLFRGAFMQSGSPVGMMDITTKQDDFDMLVANTGCTGQADPIACLRAVSFDDLAAAMNLSPNLFSFTSLSLAWHLTVDGIIITRDPQHSIQKGLYAKVPIVTGNCDDEGTLFSLANLNLTTNNEFLSYMQTNYFQSRATPKQLASLAVAYPENAALGSPYDTGTANALTPEFKRFASVQGDMIFHAPRRFLLQAASKTQPTYAFLFKRGKATPILGSVHGSDIPEFYGTGEGADFIGTDALVNFVNTGNPTLPKNPISLLSTLNWQQWGSSAAHPPLLTFLDPAPNVTITFDNFREEGMQILTQIALHVDV